MESLKKIDFTFYDKENCPDNFYPLTKENLQTEEILDICNIYYIPIQDFYALIEAKTCSITQEYVKALEKYDENNGEDNIKTIKGKKYFHVKKEQLMICRYKYYQNEEIYSFKVSLAKIIIDTTNGPEINIRNCEKDLKDVSYFSMNKDKGPAITILLSKNEIQKCLVPFNIINSFKYDLYYVRKKFVFKSEIINEKRYDFLEGHIYNNAGPYKCLVVQNSEQANPNKIKALYFRNVICPILCLKNNYEDEILISNIYGIESILEKLQNICKNNTSDNYISAIIETGTLLKRIIKSANSIEFSKKEENIITAADIIEQREAEEKLAIQQEEEFNKKFQESINIKNKNEITSFTEEIRMRKELLDIYDGKI